MNSPIDTDQYAIQQNNDGVNCYMVLGDIDGALHYFRQALSAKLATEHRLLSSTTKEASGDKTLPDLHDLDTHVLEVLPVAETASQQRSVTPEPTEMRSSDQLEECSSGDMGTTIVSL
jgi:hypothetical protein